MVVKSKRLNPGPGSLDLAPAARNIVEVKTTPDSPEPNRAPRAAAEMVPRLVPIRNNGKPGKTFTEIGDDSRNIREVIFTHAKLITHSPAGLVIGRRIQDGGDHPALNKIATASNQKVILTEFYLILFLAQPNQAAGAGKQYCYRLRILR
jgi:hypothetical protein